MNSGPFPFKPSEQTAGKNIRHEFVDERPLKFPSRDLPEASVQANPERLVAGGEGMPFSAIVAAFKALPRELRPAFQMSSVGGVVGGSQHYRVEPVERIGGMIPSGRRLPEYHSTRSGEDTRDEGNGFARLMRRTTEVPEHDKGATMRISAGVSAIQFIMEGAANPFTAQSASDFLIKLLKSIDPKHPLVEANKAAMLLTPNQSERVLEAISSKLPEAVKVKSFELVEGATVIGLIQVARLAAWRLQNPDAPPARESVTDFIGKHFV